MSIVPSRAIGTVTQSLQESAQSTVGQRGIDSDTISLFPALLEIEISTIFTPLKIVVPAMLVVYLP